MRDKSEVSQQKQQKQPLLATVREVVWSVVERIKPTSFSLKNTTPQQKKKKKGEEEEEADTEEEEGESEDEEGAQGNDGSRIMDCEPDPDEDCSIAATIANAIVKVGLGSSAGKRLISHNIKITL